MPQASLVSTANVSQGPNNLSGGTQNGASASSLESFYGATPVVQPSGAAQAAITDSSGGTAAPTNGLAALTGTYNSTLLANAIATIAAQSNAMQAALVSVGLMKGSA